MIRHLSTDHEIFPHLAEDGMLLSPMSLMFDTLRSIDAQRATNTLVVEYMYLRIYRGLGIEHLALWSTVNVSVYSVGNLI